MGDRLATIDMGRKVVGAVPLSMGGAESPSGTLFVVAWAEAYLRTKWHLDPSNRLATIDIGRQVGELLCPSGGAGSRSNTMWPGPRPTSGPSGILIHPAVLPQWTWAEKWGLLWSLFMGSSSNTMWPGPRHTSIPSGILIHPTDWPQCTNVTYRQDRQDRQTTVR